jgi:hypothetical protein
MEKKYNFVYKTTHKESGKYYIGVHSTDNIDDGYLGSGTRIKSSIKKYGKDSFERDVLRYFDNKKDAYSYENEIVTSETLKDTYCMNMQEGGIGGYGMSGEKNGMYGKGHLISGEKHPMFGKKTWMYGKKHSEESIQKIRNNNAMAMLGKKHSEESIQKMRDNSAMSMLGKKHSDETKKKMSNSSKGERNGMYGKSAISGKVWITDGVTSKYIKKEDDVPVGWRRGRVMKKRK